MNTKHLDKLLERRQNLVSLLSLSWSVLTTYCVKICLITLIVHVPLSIITSYISVDDELGLWGVQLLDYILGIIAIMSIAYLLESALFGRSISVTQAIQYALFRWWDAVQTSLLAIVTILGLLLLFIVPGVVWIVYYKFYIYAIVLRHCSGKEALEYSKKMVEGQWWHVAGYWGLVLIITLILIYVLNIPFFFTEESRLTFIILDICAALIVSYETVFLTLFFVNLDKSKHPVSINLLSSSRNPECASNIMTFGQEDGTGLIGVEPPNSRTIEASLRYRLDGMLADGILFTSGNTDRMWSIFYHRKQIICAHYWTNQVAVVADVEIHHDYLTITKIHGTFMVEDEDATFTIRVLDFLMRNHALGLSCPAPAPVELALKPEAAETWCASFFGKQAVNGISYELSPNQPEQPLRTDSLLHLAVAQGDRNKVQLILDEGTPVDLIARDGFTPLHWSLVREDTEIMRLLINGGSAVDVRSIEGATPLMNAVQYGNIEKIVLLLDHGADPNAADHRGFTALHRAAEMGDPEIVGLLLVRKALPDVEAEGHTPCSLAKVQEKTIVVEMLDGITIDEGQ